MATARVITFEAAYGARFSNEDAQRYGEFLEETVGLGRRVVPAEEVLAAAEPQDSPIHDAFEWNNRKAGHEYRLAQARQLVAHIVIRELVDEAETPVRAFHHVREETEEGPRSGYVSERIVWQRPDFAVQVKGKALRELRGWRDRYRTYEELSWAAERVGAIADELEEEAS